MRGFFFAHTLTVAEMPSHNHSFSGNTGSVTVNGGNHNHTVRDPGHGHSLQGSYQTVSNANTYPLLSDSPIKNVGVINSSTTGIWLDNSGNLTLSGSFTPQGTISDRGSNNAHNNMPPYIVKYCWERIA